MKKEMMIDEWTNQMVAERNEWKKTTPRMSEETANKLIREFNRYEEDDHEEGEKNLIFQVRFEVESKEKRQKMLNAGFWVSATFVDFVDSEMHFDARAKYLDEEGYMGTARSRIFLFEP